MFLLCFFYAFYKSNGEAPQNLQKRGIFDIPFCAYGNKSNVVHAKKDPYLNR